jgi:hypothetical protein
MSGPAPPESGFAQGEGLAILSSPPEYAGASLRDEEFRLSPAKFFAAAADAGQTMSSTRKGGSSGGTAALA